MNKDGFLYACIDIDLEPELTLREFGFEDFSQRKSNKFYHQKLYACIHLVTKGEGFFFLNGKKYTVKKGDLFVLPPKTPVMYYSSEHSPYFYYWFSIFGQGTNNLLQNLSFSLINPVRKCENYDEVLAVFESLTGQAQSIYSTKSHIYHLFSLLCKENLTIGQISTQDSPLLEEILRFININYPNPELQISQMLDLFHINQTALYRLFSKGLGKSPKKYLLEVRMKKAQELLQQGKSVTNTAYAVGFPSLYHFSKQYKNFYGYSPSQENDKTPIV